MTQLSRTTSEGLSPQEVAFGQVANENNLRDGGATSSAERNRAREISMHDKYLTFRLNNEYYGFGISKVQEIIKMQRITKVPRTAPHVKGVINLRGKVIPVIDIALKLNIRSDEYTSETCIVMVQAESASSTSVIVGIIVDAVSEVQDISVDKIDPPPALCQQGLENFILGIARTDKIVISLLDIDAALKSDLIEAQVDKIGGTQLMNKKI